MSNQSNDQKQKSNNLVRQSARRSRLNLGVATLSNSLLRGDRGNNSLGTIEMLNSLVFFHPVVSGFVENKAPDNFLNFSRKSKTFFSYQQSYYCPKCFQQLSRKSENSLRSLDGSVSSLESEVLGVGELVDDNRWKLLRRSKQLLAMRTVTPELATKLDLRRDWNLHRKIETLLDCFPSLKYSYSSLRGKKFDGSVSILSNGSTARVDDIARSHSIRLDPVDAPKELFKYRQRIQKIIAWAYANNLVPVMMTLTVFHRWHDLAPLCRVLRKAWSSLFSGSQAALARRASVGFCGYIRRMEETFNDGDKVFNSFNSGWHPHYHIIFLVPREKLSFLSSYESELRKVWVSLVCRYFRNEFGEDIPSAYLKSFEEHGLVFSRFKSVEQARKCGCLHARVGDLFEVKDGKYLAKLMGIDDPLYGGDTELTYFSKTSKTPFDLLKGAVTANLADLWCEYAIATKKIPCFTFSKGLGTEVDSYFDALSALESESESSSAPSESFQPSEPCSSTTSVASTDTVGVPMTVKDGFVFRIKSEDYQWLYRHFLIGELLKHAAQGYDVVKNWLHDICNISVLEGNQAADDVNDLELMNLDLRMMFDDDSPT